MKAACHWCGRRCKIIGKVGEHYYVASCYYCMDTDGKLPWFDVVDAENGVNHTMTGDKYISTEFSAVEERDLE